MSKLLNLKKWLTIDEAIKYLSDILEEEITLKDIYQLVLDFELVLSIKFNKPHDAVIGYPANTGEITETQNSSEAILYSNEVCKELIQFKDDVVKIEGVWDLTMFGGDKVTIERRLIHFFGSQPEMIPKFCDVVIQNDHCFARLLIDQESNPGTVGSVAFVVKEEEKLKQSGLSEAEIKSGIKELYEKREEFLGYRKDAPIEVKYYAASFIPSDVIEVIKVDQLLKLLSKVNPIDENASGNFSSKRINTKEKHSYLILISALCNKNNIDPNERGAAGRISRIAENHGTPISEDTVRKIIKEIPEALMAREK